MQWWAVPDVTPHRTIAASGPSRWRGTWRCLVRRALHAPHLRACAFRRTSELALALAAAPVRRESDASPAAPPGDVDCRATSCEADHLAWPSTTIRRRRGIGGARRQGVHRRPALRVRRSSTPRSSSPPVLAADEGPCDFCLMVDVPFDVAPTLWLYVVGSWVAVAQGVRVGPLVDELRVSAVVSSRFCP